MKPFGRFIFLIFLLLLNIFLITAFFCYRSDSQSWFYQTSNYILLNNSHALMIESSAVLLYFFADGALLVILGLASGLYYCVYGSSYLARDLTRISPFMVILVSLSGAQSGMSFYSMVLPGGYIGIKMLYYLKILLEKELVTIFIYTLWWSLFVFLSGNFINNRIIYYVKIFLLKIKTYLFYFFSYLQSSVIFCMSFLVKQNQLHK